MRSVTGSFGLGRGAPGGCIADGRDGARGNEDANDDTEEGRGAFAAAE